MAGSRVESRLGAIAVVGPGRVRHQSDHDAADDDDNDNDDKADDNHAHDNNDHHNNYDDNDKSARR